MADIVQNGRRIPAKGLVSAATIAHDTPVQQAANGVRYAVFGQNGLAVTELKRIIESVPASIAVALEQKAYYFVPLAMSSNTGTQAMDESTEVMVSPVYYPELTDDAICHRNLSLGPTEGVFISTRLLDDRFALAFEFFINVGHAFVESAGVPEAFNQLVWEQALKDVRGETSQDAWESRAQSIVRVGSGTRLTNDASPSLHIDEKAKSEYIESAFSDAVAIYQLSLALDFNYSELREREYPLLAPQSLAERLRLAARLFPPNPGYEFAIRYRRRA